jgi:hypothetical protein
MSKPELLEYLYAGNKADYKLTHKAKGKLSKSVRDLFKDKSYNNIGSNAIEDSHSDIDSG